MSYAKNFLKMDKIDKLLDAVEQPERYSPEEIEEMLQDSEVKEVADLLDKTKSSLWNIASPDIDEEWRIFEEKHKGTSALRHSWLPRIFNRNAAASIAIGIASVTALATIVGVSVHFIDNNREVEIKKTTETLKPEISASPNDSLKTVASSNNKTTETIEFDNENLETIITEIAGYYDCKAIFNKDDSKTLRLYFRWDKTLTIEEVAARLNNFEQIHITVKDNIIKVD